MRRDSGVFWRSALRRSSLMSTGLYDTFLLGSTALDARRIRQERMKGRAMKILKIELPKKAPETFEELSRLFCLVRFTMRPKTRR
jgi:hypothetical protein